MILLLKEKKKKTASEAKIKSLVTQNPVQTRELESADTTIFSLTPWKQKNGRQKRRRVAAAATFNDQTEKRSSFIHYFGGSLSSDECTNKTREKTGLIPEDALGDRRKSGQVSVSRQDGKKNR
ncbi:hypothetical protein CEXT_463531 [Caerostris extrusa]|uniref:Uncharacterized protein n=1 Tax=Caerostris extrusa TaxID=172846 RepID=A0AAV4PB87_CAEEX|nr:hypothetical protein CEXT_463531 [Caerostris extrusa]